MPDDRSLEEKLRAMATQTEVSPHEAEMARNILGRLDQSRKAGQTAGRLTREAILAQPEDSGRRPGAVIRVKIGRDWIVVDADEYAVIFPDLGFAVS